jgi:2-polyprenyl-3-methyl-5-hydroxy-6-metoxy-1,4-benzoquinol methylase
MSNAEHHTNSDRTSLVLDFHDRLIDKYGVAGDSWAIAGWSSLETQRSRFEHLLRASSFRGGTVLDWGCGPGDLYAYLLEKNRPFEYEGIDINPRMIRIATHRHGGHFTQIPSTHCLRQDYDYIFASGIFQFVDEKNPTYFVKQLSEMVKHARAAVAVNFLSDYRDDAQKAESELYLDPKSVITTLSSLSSRWVIDHSYHPGSGDFTVALIVEPTKHVWKRPDFS